MIAPVSFPSQPLSRKDEFSEFAFDTAVATTYTFTSSWSSERTACSDDHEDSEEGWGVPVASFSPDDSALPWPRNIGGPTRKGRYSDP